MDATERRDARILVVEDDANTRSFLRQGLEEEGYTVTTAEQGNKGLDLAALRGGYLAFRIFFKVFFAVGIFLLFVPL